MFSALTNVQNDFTDVRGDIRSLRQDAADTKGELAGVRRDHGEARRSLDLASTVVALRKEVDALTAEAAELRRRTS